MFSGVSSIMHDLARLIQSLSQAILTQSAHAGGVPIAAALPRFALVERLGKLPHIVCVSTLDTRCTSTRRGVKLS